MPPAGTHFAVDPDCRRTAEEAANWFQRHWRDLFVNASNAVSFEVSRISSDASRSAVRYRQKYAGLEIYAAEMLIQVGPDGGVEAMMSNIEADASPPDTGAVSLTPSVDTATAQDRAIAFFAERYKGTTLEASSPVLMIYAPSVLSNSGPIRLVWNMGVWSASGGAVGQRALVDAHDGRVVHYFSLIRIR
jgi:Zn-dependent metalloprotease